MTPSIHNLNIEAGQSDVVLRTGEAKKLDPVQPIRYSATIDAPMVFHQKYADSLIDQVLVVTVDQDHRRVILDVNPQQQQENAVIEGKLSLSKAVAVDFQINKKAEISRDDLLNLCRLNRHLFVDRSEAMQLASVLQDFQAQVDRTIQKSNDNRGSRTESIKQVAKSELPETISLLVPVFKDSQPVEITCNLYFTVKGDEVYFFLQCEELNEIIDKRATEEIEKVVTYFKESTNVPVLYL